MAFQQAPSIQVKSEVPEINTETLGFSALKGEARLQLIPSPWPTDNLPQSFSTLLSVASKRGLLAAAGPDRLIVASTAAVYSAFGQSPGPHNVISGFAPDVSITVPRLSHVAFTSDEQYLVITGEQGGGLAVYGVDALLQKNTQPSFQIPTNQLGVRVLSPNPGPGLENHVAIVLEGGQLMLADLGQKATGPVIKQNATCVAWSAKGKNLLAGLGDGTAVQLDLQGQQKALIPRPPGLESSYTVSSIYWPTNDQFFIIYHDQNVPAGDDDAMQDDQEARGFFVNTDKGRTSFSFAPFQVDCFPAMGISRRSLPQYSFLRLRKWPPHLDDMLIVSGSNSADTIVITNSSTPLGPGAVVDEYALTTLSDSRRAQLPTTVPNADSDSLPIGVALDLSSKEVVRRPIPGNDEIDPTKYPLPSLFMLSHQGILSAWWVVYDLSLTRDDGKNQIGYPGLTALSGEQAATPVSKPQPSAIAQTTPAPFAAASTPSFGAPGFSTTGPSFGKPAFGAPAAPAFGKSSFSMSSSTGAFGSGSAFGSTGGLGNRQSPWATATGTPQKPVVQPQSQPQQSPFSSLAGSSSGFAKFGGATGTLGGSTASPFSSFGASSTGQSAFASVGKPQQQSVFGSKEPSFGSTVTVGSSLGGSTLPSWQTTPAPGAISAQPSFASTRESDMGDADEDQSRERDEATPTPQVPPQQQPKGLFGVPSGGFKLDSSFKGDGSARDDLPKLAPSSTGSLFGGDFASALTSKPLVPATPVKKEEEGSNLRDISTTPSSPPKTTTGFLFSSTTPQGPSRTPAKEPVAKEKSLAPPLPDSPVIEDAPLPPDPMTWKPKKTAEEAEDEHPPLAGSPAVQVEAPESSVPSSPLDDGDDEGDISVEEQEHEEKEDGDQEEDEEEEEEEEEEQEEDEPSGSVRRPRTQNSGWKFSDSVSQSPHIPPQAPTPPVKSTATSRSREKSRSPSRSPARLSIFQQPQKTAAPSSLFGRSTTPSTFSKPGPIFPPPAISRVQENIRSPSPIRSASTSALGTRRQQLSHAPTPLAASLQQPPKPPTPAPEVSDLSDDEDERIRQELSSEVLPSRDLDEFIAHQDYKGSAGKPGIPGQIELVYRDINSMIDTLGLNARSLAAFIKYHETPIRHSELTPNDLDDVIDQGEDGDWYSKWCLTEIPDLGALVAGLEKSLDHGKVQDALGKLRQVGRVQGEKAKILTKINELRRQISNRKDVEKAEMLRSAPLPKDQADQQKTLRNEYAKLLTQLADAEEAIMFLRTKLASANAEKGQMKAVPTVDAVKKTINKMIAMTEKKNNDIVLLEAQLRKIGLEPSDRLKSSTRVRGTPGRSSVREQSPFPTPGSRGKMSIADLNRSVRTPEPDDDTPSKGFGLFYTPPGSPTRTSFNLKIADDMNDEDLEFLKETTKRRKQVAASLKSAVLKRGVKVTRMN